MLIRHLLLPLSYAPNSKPQMGQEAIVDLCLIGASRIEGTRTLTSGLKDRCANQLHHDPKKILGSCVLIEFPLQPFSKKMLCVIQVVAPRIELDATRLSVEYGQPALHYLLQSSTWESNPQPRGPKPRVLPSAPLLDICNDRLESLSEH